MDAPEFLLARIAEDEAEAREAVPPRSGSSWTVEKLTRGQSVRRGGEFPRVAEPAAAEAAHIARHDPARVLAECEAKRRIVGRHDVVDATGGCAFCGEPAPCEHLRFVALPYADHPDYRDEWRP